LGTERERRAGERSTPRGRSRTLVAVSTGPLSAAEIEARAAIHDVLMRYASGVDRRDFARVAGCFTPDATYQGQLSRRDVAEALRTLRTSLVRYDATMHLMGNQLIELHGDDRASCETYCLAHHLHRSGKERRELTVAVVYEDELARAGGAWLIRQRTARTLFVRDTRVAGDSRSAGDPAAAPREDA